jgi:hypothetical protein
MIVPQKIIKRWSSWFTESGESSISIDIRTRGATEPNDKAGVIVRRSPLIGSATVWGSGCVEWILADEFTGKILRNEDRQFELESEILEWLSDVFSVSFDVQS